jgi:hypothetical protein
MELNLTKYEVEVVLAELDDSVFISVIAKPGMSLPQDAHKLTLLAIDTIEEDEDNDIWDEPLYDDGIDFNQVLAIKIISESPLDPMDEDYDPCEKCGLGQVVNHISYGWNNIESTYLCEDCFDDLGFGRN